MQIKIKRAVTGSELLSCRGLVRFRVTEAGRIGCYFIDRKSSREFFRRLCSVVGAENVAPIGVLGVSFPTGNGCFGLLDFDVEG